MVGVDRACLRTQCGTFFILSTSYEEDIFIIFVTMPRQRPRRALQAPLKNYAYSLEMKEKIVAEAYSKANNVRSTAY